jgi:hypothetical protein
MFAPSLSDNNSDQDELLGTIRGSNYATKTLLAFSLPVLDSAKTDSPWPSAIGLLRILWTLGTTPD